MKSTDKEYDLFETKKEPRKSLQTYLRNKNKLIINSYNMVDRKSAIMIRVNSTLISAVIIFFYKLETIPNGNYIGTILIVTCFFSLLFSLNASRPHAFGAFIKFRQIMRENGGREESIFVSGMISNMSNDEYLEAYDKLVRDQRLQIKNQLISMRQMERNVVKSFMFIEFSYLTFILGFISIVILFLLGEMNICFTTKF